MLDYDYIYLLYIPIGMTLVLTGSRKIKSRYGHLLVLSFFIAQVLLGLALRGGSDRFWLNTLLFSVLPFGLVAMILSIPDVKKRPVLMLLLGVPIFWLGALIGVWIFMALGYGP